MFAIRDENLLPENLIKDDPDTIDFDLMILDDQKYIFSEMIGHYPSKIINKYIRECNIEYYECSKAITAIRKKKKKEMIKIEMVQLICDLLEKAHMTNSQWKKVYISLVKLGLTALVPYAMLFGPKISNPSILFKHINPDDEIELNILKDILLGEGYGEDDLLSKKKEKKVSNHKINDISFIDDTDLASLLETIDDLKRDTKEKIIKFILNKRYIRSGIIAVRRGYIKKITDVFKLLGIVKKKVIYFGMYRQRWSYDRKNKNSYTVITKKQNEQLCIDLIREFNNQQGYQTGHNAKEIIMLFMQIGYFDLIIEICQVFNMIKNFNLPTYRIIRLINKDDPEILIKMIKSKIVSVKNLHKNRLLMGMIYDNKYRIAEYMIKELHIKIPLTIFNSYYHTKGNIMNMIKFCDRMDFPWRLLKRIPTFLLDFPKAVKYLKDKHGLPIKLNKRYEPYLYIKHSFNNKSDDQIKKMTTDLYIGMKDRRWNENWSKMCLTSAILMKYKNIASDSKILSYSIIYNNMQLIEVLLKHDKSVYDNLDWDILQPYIIESIDELNNSYMIEQCLRNIFYLIDNANRCVADKIRSILGIYSEDVRRKIYSQVVSQIWNIENNTFLYVLDIKIDKTMLDDMVDYNTIHMLPCLINHIELTKDMVEFIIGHLTTNNGFIILEKKLNENNDSLKHYLNINHLNRQIRFHDHITMKFFIKKMGIMPSQLSVKIILAVVSNFRINEDILKLILQHCNIVEKEQYRRFIENEKRPHIIKLFENCVFVDEIDLLPEEDPSIYNDLYPNINVHDHLAILFGDDNDNDDAKIDVVNDVDEVDEVLKEIENSR